MRKKKEGKYSRKKRKRENKEKATRKILKIECNFPIFVILEHL